MTEHLEQAVQTLRGLSPDMQDEPASFDLSRAQEDAGDFATDAQVRAIWAKHGL